MLSVLLNVTAASIGIGVVCQVFSLFNLNMHCHLQDMLVAIVVPMLLTFFFRKAGLFTKTQRAIRTCRQNVAQEEKQIVNHEPVELTSVEIISPH